MNDILCIAFWTFQSLYYIFSGSVQEVKIITFRITRLYKWEGQGLKLEVRKESFWAAWKSVALMSLTCMSRHYELPEWLVFLSPVYWITALCSFNISSLFKCSTVLWQRMRKFFLVWNLSQVHVPKEICLIKELSAHLERFSVPIFVVQL